MGEFDKAVRQMLRPVSCPKCGDHRQVEPVAGVVWYCNQCSKEFVVEKTRDPNF